MSIPRARKAYEDFSGHTPKRVNKSRLPDRDVTGWKMGPVVGIAYEAKRDGVTQKYFHEFKKHARPDLVAQDDGSQLYIDGGRYKVTERGIEDMPALFVVNPSPRRGRKGAVKKRKAPAMAVRRRRRSTRRKASPVTVYARNPARRRRRRVTARAAAPRRRRRVTYARNPAPRRRRRASRALGGAVNFGKMLLPAIGIGAGAVGAEVIMGYLPIPSQFKTGVLRHVTKGVVAVTAGMLVGKVLRQKKLGDYIALGGVVIAAHDALKEVINARMPSIPFGEYLPRSTYSAGALGYYSPAQGVDYSAMGEYVPAFRGGLGESPDFQA